MAMTFAKSNQSQGGAVSNWKFYWQFYGLKRDPFSAIPDDSMAVLLPKRQEQLDLLSHLIETENVLIGVIGAKGYGKTTLLHQFMKHNRERYFIHQLSAQAEMDLKKLLAILAKSFKLSMSDSDLVEEKLDGFIADIQYKENICVLAIDDAQNLPEETLQALIYLLKQQSNQQMKFHIMLLGDVDLQSKLSSLAMRELGGELIHTIDLAVIPKKEIKHYLQHRMMVAGLKGPMPFAPMTIEQIEHLSQGIPESINRVAQQALLDDIAKHEADFAPRSFFSKHQTKFLGAAVVVVCIALVGLILTRVSNDEQHSRSMQQQSISLQTNNQLPPTKSANVQEAQPLNDPKAVAVIPLSEYKKEQREALAKERALMKTSMHETQAAIPAHSANTPVISFAVNNVQHNQASQQPEAAAPAQQAAAPAQQAAAPAQQAAAPAQQAAAPAQQAAAPAQQAAAPAQASQQPDIRAKLFPNQQLAPEAVIAKQSERAEQHAADATPAATQPHSAAAANTAKKPAAHKAELAKHAASSKPHQAVKAAKHIVVAPQKQAHKSLPANEKQLMAVKKDHYTLQILALANESAVKAFIAKHHLQKDTHYYRNNVKGKTWYVLVYGNYPTYSEALKATQHLPSAFKAYKPWVRSFASVKQDINKA